MTQVPAAKVKKSYKKYFIAGGIVLFCLIVYIGMQPIRGTINFGICKVFIEQNETYPQEIRYVSLLERGPEVRIEYMIMNEFGEYQSKTTQCLLKFDPAAGLVVTDIMTDRKLVPKEKVEMFNKGIPAILAYPPDLTSPGMLPADLTLLWRDH